MSSKPGPPATLGGIPSTIPDIPVSAVLLALFVAGGATHMTLFVRNRRRNHRFIFSFVLFMFTVTRVAALSLRIAWARSPRNPDLTLAATLFTAAGVLILFIINLVLAERTIRALHPAILLGRARRLLQWGFRALLASVVAVLIMVVVCTVHSNLTTDVAAKSKERDVMLFAGVYMTVVALLPAVAVGLAWALPQRRGHRPSNPSDGEVLLLGRKGDRMGPKVALLVSASLLLTLGAGFRAGVNFATKPAGQEQWYHSKPALYCFSFAIELVVVYSYAIFRFDRMFYVPDSGNNKEVGHGSESQEVGMSLSSEKGRSGDSGRELVDRPMYDDAGRYEV
ncbi:hypothetical protein P885DRAFT_72322 [Corynascus similis CBS 632.67]